MTDKPCLCNGLKLISDMVNLFDEIGTCGGTTCGIKSTRIQQEKAYTIASKLLPIISEKDINPWITETELSTKRLKEFFIFARKELRNCKENIGMDCVFALDDTRALIHQNAGIRAKLLCETDIHSSNNKKTKEIMNTLRGVRWGTSKQARFLTDELINEVTCSTYIE